MNVQRRLDRPLQGIALIVAASVCSALSDATAKILTATLPGVQILWIRYLTFVAIMLVLVAPRPSLFFTRRPKFQIYRGLLVIISALLFVLGLRVLPISVATTIFYVSPIFVTAMSIVFLGESVGPRRWAAAIIGLVGVFLVVRPGSSDFTVAVLLPIGSAAFWAGSLIVTRMMSGLEEPRTTLLHSAMTGLVVLTMLLPFNWVTPSLTDIAFALFVGIAATTGQWMIILAYRLADASVLAPLSYVQILWATAIGFLMFEESPDLISLAGAATIIGSGVYTAHRERRRRGAVATGPHP